MFEFINGDRVIVAKDGKAVKARVASVNAQFGKVGVTFAKGETPTVYAASDVYPLYRYVMTPEGPGVLPIFLAK